jgi:phage anti-repressor protein
MMPPEYGVLPDDDHEWYDAVEPGQQAQAVNLRELHERLDVGRDFSHWVKGRIAQYGFIEGRDYVTVPSPVLGGVSAP